LFQFILPLFFCLQRKFIFSVALGCRVGRAQAKQCALDLEWLFSASLDRHWRERNQENQPIPNDKAGGECLDMHSLS